MSELDWPRTCNRGHALPHHTTWCDECDSYAPGPTRPAPGQVSKNVTHRHLLDRTQNLVERVQKIDTTLADIHYRVGWLQTPPGTAWFIRNCHRYVQTLILIVILWRVW